MGASFKIELEFLFLCLFTLSQFSFEIKKKLLFTSVRFAKEATTTKTK